MDKTTFTKSSSEQSLRVRLSGFDLINSPRLNKGTAFTEEERAAFDLFGLLPPHVGSLDQQRQRRVKAFHAQPNAFAQYAFMRDLQDANETLFYSLITHNIAEMLPIVYTPTVGEGCQRFSEIWRKPRGLFLSYPEQEHLEHILAHPRYNGIKCIVVSDGERILGLGDQGAGGMGIPIGKMALYTALAGIPPEACLPILLDVGTDNQERLADPLYIGWRHERIRGAEYDAFIERFVAAVKKRWPHVLLQWEDFAGNNAARLLDRYRNQLCTFNDDIQGTAAVATATLLAAINVTGIPLKEQRIAIVGFGSAGLGIAGLILSAMEDDGLSAEEARQRFYAIDRDGLLVEGAENLRPQQQPFARSQAEVQEWKRSGKKTEIGLEDVVRNAGITVLIGVSGQPGVFSEEAVRAMARNAERPVIFPLSNPTSRSEATPQQLLDWTAGKALVGTGSPFDPVTVNGQQVTIDQTNNSYIFPGLALGIIASQARYVSDGMIQAAAKALAELSPTRTDKAASLLPPLETIRDVSRHVAEAVARQAIEEGLAGIGVAELPQHLEDNIWEPLYIRYEPESNR
jgi:malate dehydrogenase (oxaloacetate-decarboxylating)